MKGQPVRLVVQVPVNASFSINVRIQTGDADAGIAAPFASCTPNGCFVDFDIRDDVLKKFRTAYWRRQAFLCRRRRPRRQRPAVVQWI